jgi:uncharacterized protein YjfI (DUF2170 family)
MDTGHNNFKISNMNQLKIFAKLTLDNIENEMAYLEDFEHSLRNKMTDYDYEHRYAVLEGQQIIIENLLKAIN